MDQTLKQIIGLKEGEEDEHKLRQEVVVYLTPEQIGDDKGAHCGACIFFNSGRSECLLTSPAACNADKGVCSAFLGGDSIFKSGGKPLKILPKESAGYIEKGPTRCGLCEYWQGKKAGHGEDAETGSVTSTCEKVRGTVAAGGCCNKWEEC